MIRSVSIFAAIACAVALSSAPRTALADIFHPKSDSAPDQAVVQSAAEIQRAIGEERYLDARSMLDEAFLGGVKDPVFVVLAGQLGLAQKDYTDALSKFGAVDKDPTVRQRALEGEGIALAGLGRSKEAIEKLQAAVVANPAAWRAWNVLGQEYDDARDWPAAEAAYQHALAASDDPAIVLNNRGFSRLLQRRLDDAVTDLVTALEKRPGLEIARTNLRLAMAMRGDYDRATAGGANDHAAVLNNAGFAAILRGDYVRAEELLQEAIKSKGQYYGRATANLNLAQALEARADPQGKLADASH